MIKTCPICGGLFATEEGEMFAGTPCNCECKTMKQVETIPETGRTERRTMTRNIIRFKIQDLIEELEALVEQFEAQAETYEIINELELQSGTIQTIIDDYRKSLPMNYLMKTN